MKIGNKKIISKMMSLFNFI